MTSQTGSSSEFLTIMKELRAHAHARSENPLIGPYIPSANVKVAYEQLQTLPVSNSDASDDIQQQIKAVASEGATNAADTLKRDVENALAAYVSQVQAGTGEAQAAFKLKMEASKITATANNDAALEQAYKKGDELEEGRNAAVIAAVDARIDIVFSHITEMYCHLHGWSCAKSTRRGERCGVR